MREQQKTPLRVLDIGTGTGCIPITLALEVKQWEVVGLDVSKQALAVAEANATKLHAPVKFMELDILKHEIPFENLDVIVSNPPYIPENERPQMHRNVVDFDPAIALFVANQRPLLFYEEIAKKGQAALKAGGKLYFEIHENFGNEVIALLEGLNYIHVNLMQDLQGKDRMISATKGT